MDKPILRLEEVSIRFGDLQAVNRCSFEMGKAEIFSLSGPNGAGKATIFNIINALYKPDTRAWSGWRVRMSSPLNPIRLHNVGLSEHFRTLSFSTR